MSDTVDAPLQWVESITLLRLPEHADKRLQELMDRNNDGLLSEQERADLEALAELSERLSLVRAEALHLLGRKRVQVRWAAGQLDENRSIGPAGLNLACLGHPHVAGQGQAAQGQRAGFEHVASFDAVAGAVGIHRVCLANVDC